ncbi:high affinity copper uptake 1-like [Brachionus plicatilis]|uniref:Copper transport protein n=1 Tax=Brachionus plicatilis TaxID=10195 RepID=A0A3M7SAC0_BRAPC|nr:high affinity copper uptake 1-like [Brachionus plicatilis]
MSHHDHDAMSSTMNPHVDHTTSMDHSGHDHSGHQMMMIMHSGLKEIIVFPGWKTNNLIELLVSCIALMIIAILYEALKLFRDRITASKLVKRHKVEMESSTSKTQCSTKQQSYKEKLLSTEHFIQTILHVIQFTISYFIMLAFMTYNYWLCLSILIGIGIGFFFFGVRRTKIDLNEDCH